MVQSTSGDAPIMPNPTTTLLRSFLPNSGQNPAKSNQTTYFPVRAYYSLRLTFRKKLSHN
ncbi:unnamed protein product [Rhodiola kirilowii]